MHKDSQWLYYKTKIDSCKALFSLLRMSVNLNFVYTLDHIVVSKTTLVCIAAYVHPECFILINLDQLVTKQATAMANSNRMSKFFLYLGCVYIFLQQTVCIPICTTFGHSIWASHHGSNAPYIIATMLVFVGQNQCMHGDSQGLYYKTE